MTRQRVFRSHAMPLTIWDQAISQPNGSNLLHTVLASLDVGCAKSERLHMYQHLSPEEAHALAAPPATLSISSLSQTHLHPSSAL